MKTAGDIHARNRHTAPGQTPGAGLRNPDTDKSRPEHRIEKIHTDSGIDHPKPFPGLQNGPPHTESNRSFADGAARRYRMIFGQGMH